MNGSATVSEYGPVVIDWNEEWARARAESSIAGRRPGKKTYWNKRANRFSAMDNGAEGRVRAVLDRIGVDQDTTILDIGCGPGNLAIPLAKHARSVTALDPAEAMLDKLEKRAADEGMTNIRTLNKGWDEALHDGDVAPHDLVLASYSLIMEDVGSALAAMHAVAERTVCLFWFADRQSFGYDRFWPRLFGEEYVPGPDHTILLNILNCLGIHPEVSIIPQQHVTRYDSFDDAVQCWCENLYTDSPRERDIIHSILLETLDLDAEKPTLRRDVRTAMIWWNKWSMPSVSNPVVAS